MFRAVEFWLIKCLLAVAGGPDRSPRRRPQPSESPLILPRLAHAAARIPERGSGRPNPSVELRPSRPAAGNTAPGWRPPRLGAATALGPSGSAECAR